MRAQIDSAARRLIACAALLAAYASTAIAQSPPKSLEQLAKRRQAIVTAQIEWSIESPSLAEKPLFRQSARELFSTALLAGEDLLNIERGDSEGVLSRDPDGKPARYSQSPRQLLRDGEDVWEYQQNSLDAGIRPVGATRLPPDLRSLGAAPMFDPRGIAEVLGIDDQSGSASREYTETTDGRFTVVTARMGEATLSWRLDPDRDWNPVQVTWRDEMGVVRETRTTYRKSGDNWFPETVTAFSREYKDGREPSEIVRIRAVVINDPEQPKKLGPVDLGMEAGVSVGKYDSSGGPPAAFKFDGEKLVTVQEFNDRVKAGELKNGPKVDAEMARLMELPQNAAAKRVTGERELDSWYRYTSSVIERYALSGEQIQKARLICGECQERRNAFLTAKKDVLDAAQKSVTDARQADPPDWAVIDRADAKFAELLTPVTEIFEKQLKPRLEKLPTRAQRAAAEARENAQARTRDSAESKPVQK